jgi:hypothetical protein
MKKAAASFREMNLRVYQGQSLPHVFFQPRFEPWYDWHKRFDKLPPDYSSMSVRDLYDYVNASMRYIHYFTGIPDPVIQTFMPGVKILENIRDDEKFRTYQTPYGDLTETLKYTLDHEWRTVEFLAKSVADLRALRWLLERLEYTFSCENFMLGSEFVGQRSEPQFWLPKSPYQALAQTYMKMPHLIYALADAPGEVEDTFKVIDAPYDQLYHQVIDSGVVKIVNFGENIHDAYFSPRTFAKYLLPWYEKRSGQLRQAGIFTHIHIDGYFHSILKYLKDLPFDGLEALTPTPQGDCTLEEIREAIGDKILLDGIPAVFFIHTYSRETLMACVEKIVEYFHPRLILGVSDEVPQGTGQEAIERLKMVSEWCMNHPG